MECKVCGRAVSYTGFCGFCVADGKAPSTSPFRVGGIYKTRKGFLRRVAMVGMVIHVEAKGNSGWQNAGERDFEGVWHSGNGAFDLLPEEVGFDPSGLSIEAEPGVRQAVSARSFDAPYGHKAAILDTQTGCGKGAPVDPDLGVRDSDIDGRPPLEREVGGPFDPFKEFEVTKGGQVSPERPAAEHPLARDPGYKTPNGRSLWTPWKGGSS